MLSLGSYKPPVRCCNRPSILWWSFQKCSYRWRVEQIRVAVGFVVAAALVSVAMVNAGTPKHVPAPTDALGDATPVPVH